MRIKEILRDYLIMPQSIDTLGLIHKPGKGPNNRFDFKNVGNNKANEVGEARGTCWRRYQQKGYKKKGNRMVPNCVKEEAAGVGIVTKQNATKDVPVGGEYMNVKKMHLGQGKPKKVRENFADKKVKGKSRPGRVKEQELVVKDLYQVYEEKLRNMGASEARCIIGVPT